MPTMKQVDEMIAKLAQKFHFSEDEARRFLDLPVEVKPKPKPKAKPHPIISGDFPTPPKTKAGKAKPDQDAGEYLGRHTTRLPTPYQNFVKAESARVREELLGHMQQAKLERGQLQKELGARWKAMSAEEKSVYTK